MEKFNSVSSLFCGILFLFALTSSFANKTIYEGKMDGPKPNIYSADWTLQSEVNGVKIYYQISSCQNTSVVFLKFENTNSHNVEISWKEVFATSQAPTEKEGYMGPRKLILKPGVTSQSDCNQVTIAECVRFAHQLEPTYIADIIKFGLKDVSVRRPS